MRAEGGSDARIMVSWIFRLARRVPVSFGGEHQLFAPRRSQARTPAGGIANARAVRPSRDETFGEFQNGLHAQGAPRGSDHRSRNRRYPETAGRSADGL